MWYEIKSGGREGGSILRHLRQRFHYYCLWAPKMDHCELSAKFDLHLSLDLKRNRRKTLGGSGSAFGASPHTMYYWTVKWFISDLGQIYFNDE